MEQASSKLNEIAERFATRSTWFYAASLVEIAVAADILSSWTPHLYFALAVPLALAAVGVAASMGGAYAAIVTIGLTGIQLLLWRWAHTQHLSELDFVGLGLYCLTALVLAVLALQRRSFEAKLVQREREEREAREREQELNREKDEFLSLVAHELRNPVAVIVGSADLLVRDTIEPAEMQGLVQGLSLESRRLRDLIEDLLSLARADAGFEFALEPVLVQRLVPKCIDEFHDRFGNDVTLQVDPNLPAAAAASVQVERVLANLLSNAGKYAPLDSEIDLHAACSDGVIEIDVLDHGPGVPPEEIELIFKSFHRQRSAEEIRGYGLGLTIAKRLVEANRGQIWARNRDGGGLDVGFSLPVYGQYASGAGEAF